jgi:hypothetical protein
MGSNPGAEKAPQGLMRPFAPEVAGALMADGHTVQRMQLCPVGTASLCSSRVRPHPVAGGVEVEAVHQAVLPGAVQGG